VNVEELPENLRRDLLSRISRQRRKSELGSSAISSGVIQRWPTCSLTSRPMTDLRARVEMELLRK
jgi:hypothetical protein